MPKGSIMYVRQSDRDIISAANEGRIKLGRLSFTGEAGELLAISDRLLEQVVDELSAAITTIDDEGVEASEARVRMEEAEDRMEASYADLYDGLVITHRHRRLGSRGQPKSHTGELDRYLDGNNPSKFAESARADKIPVMDKALSHLDAYMATGLVPDAIVDEARQNHQGFSEAYATFVAEEADVTDARNVADQVRATCRSKFIAAREVLSAALRLSGVERPVSEYLPAFTDLLRGNYTPSDEPAQDPQPEPVDA